MFSLFPRWLCVLGCAATLANFAAAQATPSTNADPNTSPPTLRIDWPIDGSVLTLGRSADQAVGIVVSSNFTLKPAGQCGAAPRCGHIHLKIDPEGDHCNQPAKPYNSMNSDFGGPLIAARFGYCTHPTGAHVVGVLLADDRHQPVLVNGQPVTALVRVTTR